MSTTNYSTENPTPTVVTRRPMQTNENTGNASQRSTNRRSLSVKLRDLFRKDSSVSDRSANNRRSPPPSVRQSSSSPAPTSEAPHLHTPSIPWPFGKKKNKSSTTTNTAKTSKIKVKKEKRKTKQSTSTNISSPVYEQENQSTSIHGQHFVPRSPQFEHGSTERVLTSTTYQSPTAATTTTTTTGFREYVITDQTGRSQQVIVPEGDVFSPPTYTSDRSRSPSMNRQRQVEYHYQYDRSTSPVSIPLPDIDVIPTPPQKRKVNITPTPIERPERSSYTSPKPTQWKNTSSSTINKTETYRTGSPSMEVDVPKLTTPTIPFGSTSSKKKSKKNKSKTHVDTKTGSSTTINNLIQQNPIQPNRPWSSTYGSLPDAEMVYDSALISAKPSKSTAKAYPGLSAIVRHHLRPAPVYYNQYPSTTTITSSPHRTQRFETSTTTLNEHDQNQTWSQPSIYSSGPVFSSNQHHDGYIRPLTPQRPVIHADITITHVNSDDTHQQTPPVRPIHQQRPESPATYRSSTTVYTRDKQQHVNGGEIRTWSVQKDDTRDDYNSSYRQPYTHVETDRSTNQYDVHITPPKICDNSQEYRYSPRAHEREIYEKKEKFIDRKGQKFHEREEEECYEVQFEYEHQVPAYTYETNKQYDELYSKNRYSSNSAVDKSPYSTLKSERDKIYDQSARSNQYIQETRSTVTPVRGSSPLIRNCTLRRTNSYDGLGILISADSQTRLNHYIREVEPNSPGHFAGLRKNDRIISINGVNVENVDFSNVLALLKQGLINDNLIISVIDEPQHI